MWVFAKQFLFFFVISLMCLSLAMLGPRCRVGSSLVAMSGGHSCVGASGLLITVAPRAEEHGLQSVGFSGCGPWALGHRLASCAARAYWLRGMWDLPSPGIEPVSPASAGGGLSHGATGEAHFLS